MTRMRIEHGLTEYSFGYLSTNETKEKKHMRITMLWPTNTGVSVTYGIKKRTDENIKFSFFFFSLFYLTYEITSFFVCSSSFVVRQWWTNKDLCQRLFIPKKKNVKE